MIPLKSDNPHRSFAFVNGLLITANVVVFLYQISLPAKAGDRLVFAFGLVPARVGQMLVTPMGHVSGALIPILTSMFLHGGWLHLLGNMLFLWVFGSSVEDRLGHMAYFVFYIICGIGAALTHIATNWGSTLPTIGASGAISGVMGAYIVLFPRSRILTLVPLLIFFFTIRIPAVLMLGYWFFIQFASGLSTLGQTNQGGVAWWAHIGGFILGAMLVLGLRQGRASRPRPVGYW